MHLSKFIDTDFGSVTISVLLGLGVAGLFRSMCKDGKCIVIQGPKSSEVENYYYKMNGDCYKYRPMLAPCEDK